MTREEMISKLSLVDEVLPKDAYAVTYSGALVALGIKPECRDIDITVTDAEAWDKLVKSGYTPIEYNGGLKISFAEDIDLHFGGLLTELETVQLIDGHWIQSLDSVAVEKINRGRPKDLADVRLIEDALGKVTMHVIDKMFA